MDPKPVSRWMSRGTWLRLCVPIALLCSLPWITTGCNDYPLQLLVAQPYTEITDTLNQAENKAVDILFVMDNSGSMKEEQEKLARNFGGFINELTTKDVGNYQIGIVSTDMDDPLQRGKLLSQGGAPRIINRLQLSAGQVVEAFKKNIVVGIKGTSYEKALDAMRASLSKKLLDDPNGNKGFLRPGALLAIIFIGDEDDCSHNGAIAETELDSEVCRLPKSETLVDEQGNPLPDAKGQPVKGHLENLTPVKDYIDFLKTLNRDIVVAGLIGNPFVKKADGNILRPTGGCKTNVECSSANAAHKCVFNTPSTRECGGCKSPDADAVPGFRLYEVIKAFGGTDSWFPICGDDLGFQEALLKFAGLIINKLNFVVLTREPVDTKAMTIKIVFSDGRPAQLIQPAVKAGRACDKDSVCGGNFICGPDGQCYGDGWVYFNVGGQFKLALSGTAKGAATPGSQISVTYSTK